MSDHRRLSEVSSLALRKTKKASVNADQSSLFSMTEWALLLFSWWFFCSFLDVDCNREMLPGGVSLTAFNAFAQKVQEGVI